MSEVCDCDFTGYNLGKPGCADLPGVDEYFIFASFFNSTNAVQHVSTSATLDTTYFNARLYKYDDSGAAVNVKDRWFITPLLEMVESKREESKKKEWPSGRKKRLGDGEKTVTAVIDSATVTQLRELKKVGCTDIGFLKVDAKGNLIGNGITESGKLRFIRIDKESWDAILQEPNYEDAQQITISFQWHTSEKDENLKMIKATAMSYTLADTIPTYLIDVTQVGTMSTTVHTFDLFHTYDDAVGTTPIRGLVTANFEYYNTTDAAVVTPSGVVESTTDYGRYTATYAAQTAADGMRLRVIFDGIDDTDVYATAFVIGS